MTLPVLYEEKMPGKDKDYWSQPFWKKAPWTIAFCYPHPEFGKPFVIKGLEDNLDQVLKKIQAPVFVHKTFYHKGANRRLCKVFNVAGDVYILRRTPMVQLLRRPLFNLRSFFKVHMVRTVSEDFQKLRKTEMRSIQIRRVPRRWMTEFDWLLFPRATYRRINM